MRDITIIGVSGFVGSAILNEALMRNYQIDAIVRNPLNVHATSLDLTVTKGDVMDEKGLEKLLYKKQVVISAYHPGWKNPNVYDDTLKAYTNIIRASKRAGVKRLLIVGGAGTLLVEPNKAVIDTGWIPDAILPNVKGLLKVYNDLLKPEKELDWVFFNPAGNLVPGSRTGRFRLGKDYLIFNDKGESVISVQDYAVAMLNEVEKQDYHKERFTIGY